MNIHMYNSNPTLIDIVYEALTRLGFCAVIKDRGLPKGAKKRAYEIRIKGWKESMKFILLVKPIIKVPRWIKSAQEAWLPMGAES
uniref:Homing endonuclease n=1 Tax=Ligamenvirales sp. TaxID=2832923 RepID=A0AAU6PXA0_9VIRU